MLVPTKQLKRHRADGTRRMAAHPALPLYVSGSQDGSVTIYEWNHQTPISTPRPGGTFAKVTHLEFNQQGNKFGVSDGDGNISLWQVSTSSTTKPFYVSSCTSVASNSDLSNAWSNRVLRCTARTAATSRFWDVPVFWSLLVTPQTTRTSACGTLCCPPKSRWSRLSHVTNITVHQRSCSHH